MKLSLGLDKQRIKSPPEPFPMWMLDAAVLSGHKQPGQFTVLLYPTYAVMKAGAVECLSTYSDNPHRVPYNKFQGMMWRSDRKDAWYLNWLDYEVGSEELSHFSLPIITVEMLDLLDPPQEMPF